MDRRLMWENLCQAQQYWTLFAHATTLQKKAATTQPYVDFVRRWYQCFLGSRGIWEVSDASQWKYVMWSGGGGGTYVLGLNMKKDLSSEVSPKARMSWGC